MTSNKNKNKSNFEKSKQTKVNKLKMELTLLKIPGLPASHFHQEINYQYQRNEATSTYTDALIKQIKP